MTIRKIKVYGQLRRFLGQAEFEADVRNVLEVVSFFKCNFKGFAKHFADNYYFIKIGNTVITDDLVTMVSESDIKIVPVAHGNIFGLFIGAGLKWLGGSIGTKLLGSQLLATVVGGALTSIGTSMLIDGVTSLIAPQQNNFSPTSGMDSTDPAALASNYSFTGLSNVSQPGVPVNIVFGEIMVGSITISNGVDTVQVEGEN
ncbi:MAG TPA: hypothetical protein DCM40_06240 [Maribacter sp.]|nr:hypothetical protein [Maribacter sp.]